MNRMRDPRLHEDQIRRVHDQADLLDLLWDEDKENIHPLAMLETLANVNNRRTPAHIRDPNSPELGTARVGFASRFEELEIQNEGPPDSLRPFADAQPHYYQGYERPFRNADGEDPFPRATRGSRPRGQAEEPDDNWEIFVDERDKERHYFHYSSDEVSLDEAVEEEEEEEEEEDSHAQEVELPPHALTTLTESHTPEPWVPGSRTSSPEPEPELPPLQANRRLVPSLSEGTLLAPRPIARMRRQRGSRGLREQARLEILRRNEVNSES